MSLNVVTLVVAVMLQVCLKDSVADIGTECPNGAGCNVATEFCDTTPATHVCACNVLHAAQAGTQTCIAKACNTDEDCGADTNAVCNSDENCECGTTFKLDPSSGNCIAKVLDDGCTVGGGECADINNAYCINLKCACRPLYDGTACTPKQCSDDNTACTSITNAECSNGVCSCVQGARENEQTGVCTTIVLGDTCMENKGECANIDNAYCINGKCDCGPLYTQSGASCTKKTCTASDDTTPCDAIENAECSEDNSECMCASGYQENTQTGQCTRSSENGASRLKITGLFLLVLTVVYLY